MRRTTGAVFLLPLLGISVFALLQLRHVWPGQWGSTLDMVTGTTVLTGPLTAAFAGSVALGLHRMAEVADSTPRGVLVPYRAALHAWAWSFLGYAAVASVALAVTFSRPHGGPLQSWVLMIGPAVLLVCAFLGVLAVRAWPHRMAVVLVAPVVFVLTGFGPAPYADLLRPGPTTGSLAGLAFARDHGLLQLTCLLGMAGVLVVVLLPWSRSSLRIGTAAALTVCVGVVVVSGAALAGSEAARLLADDERPTACAGNAPRVCLAPSERRGLARTAAPMAAAARELQEIGIDLPGRYEQLLPGYRPGVDVGMIGVSAETGRLSLAQAAENIATPAGCAAWTDPSQPPPDGAFNGQRLVVNWVLVRAGARPDPWSRAERDWLRTADSAAAQEQVRRIVGQLRSCDLEAIRLPWSAPA